MVASPFTSHRFYLPKFKRVFTHTDRYLHYMSYHPKHKKIIVAKTLLASFNTRITGKTHKHPTKHTRTTLRLNRFPIRTTFLTPGYSNLLNDQTA